MRLRWERCKICIVTRARRQRSIRKVRGQDYLWKSERQSRTLMEAELVLS
jgi:hypothetical protein